MFVMLATDRHKVKGLVGGLPPATALWNLKLALAYYSTSQVQLLSDLSTVAGSFPDTPFQNLILRYYLHTALSCPLADTLECDVFVAPLQLERLNWLCLHMFVYFRQVGSNGSRCCDQASLRPYGRSWLAYGRI